MFIHTPPSFSELLKNNSDKIAKIVSDPSAKAALSKINERYMHWDDLRHRKHLYPEGYSLDETWMALVLGRMSQFTELTISFDNDSYLNVWCPPKALQYLHQIDQLAGGNIGAASKYAVSDVKSERYLVSSLMEEAISSSQLEGAVTTRRIAKDMLRSQRKPKDNSERMISNNYAAINEIRDRKNDKLTPEFLISLQSILTEKTMDQGDVGRFRNDEDKVCIVDSRTGDSVYTPPEAFFIESRIEEICDFANDEDEEFIHPVVKAITLHFAIGLVHPFVDGNGRTARAIFYWYMIKHGYWMIEYLPISRIFLQAPVKYSRAYLLTENDSGDLTYFVFYHLKVILRAIKELHAYIRDEQERRQDNIELLSVFPGINIRQASLLEDAIRRPKALYDVRTYQGANQIAYATARNDLNKLAEAGLLDKFMNGKAYNFRPAKDLEKTVRRKSKVSPSKPASKSQEPSEFGSEYSEMPLFSHLNVAQKIDD